MSQHAISDVLCRDSSYSNPIIIALSVTCTLGNLKNQAFLIFKALNATRLYSWSPVISMAIVLLTYKLYM